jgi:S1-C subfamily serine protease
MKKLMKSMVGFFAVLAGAAIMIVLSHFAAWAKDPAPVINLDTTPIVRAAGASGSFAPIIKRAAPSVINIYSARTVHLRRNSAFDDPFFSQFFGDPSGGPSAGNIASAPASSFRPTDIF